jgi:hypothetical protein
MKTSEAERRLRHKRFLQANLGMLAAFAWEHYQTEGRGAVVADERDFIHTPEPHYTTIHLHYLAEGSPRLQELGGWPGDKEAGWVKTYDPETRMVVFIVREDRGVSSYFLIPPIRPSQAFADQQARGN